MKAVIAGAGFVGEELALWLLKNKFDVSIIDNDKKLIESITERINVKGIVGDAISKENLVAAEVEIADFLLLVTSSNSANILAGIEGKKLGARNVIVKVNNYDNASDFKYYKEKYGIDVILDSAELTASKIIQMMFIPSMIRIIPFSNNEICMLEHKITKNSKLVDTLLRDLPTKIKTPILIISIKRDKEYFIPTGGDKLIKNDLLYILCEPSNASNILKQLEDEDADDSPNEFAIMSGGKLAYRTAKYFNNKKIPCTIYEASLDQCSELMNTFPNLNVVHLGPKDFNKKSLNVGAKTSVLCATSKDETNLFYSTGLNALGAGNVIVHIDNEAYASMLSNVKAQTLITKDMVLVDEIIKAMRLEININDSAIEHELLPEIYTYQFRLKDEKIDGLMIKDIKLKKNTMLGMILRKDEIIIPNGKTTIKSDDELFIISTNTKIKKIKDILG